VRRLAAWVGLSLPLVVAAAPEEIKVFTDELAGYGESTLEVHVNKASRGAPLQLMPEYSYGIRRDWELSLQLPLAFQDGVRGNGYRAELQYIAPHDDAAGSYWGVNFELAHISRAGEQRFWNLEFIPIAGWRGDRWHLVANPGLNLAVTGPDRKLHFDPSAKAAYRTDGRNYFGIEYYLEAGPLAHWLPGGQRSQVLYLAWDGKVGKSDINVGIGRGLTDASDPWVLKMICEFAF
jgi:hypothetical protein